MECYNPRQEHEKYAIAPALLIGAPGLTDKGLRLYLGALLLADSNGCFSLSWAELAKHFGCPLSTLKTKFNELKTHRLLDWEHQKEGGEYIASLYRFPTPTYWNMDTLYPKTGLRGEIR